MKIFIINIALLSLISIIINILINIPRKKVQHKIVNQLEGTSVLEQFILMISLTAVMVLAFNESLGLSIDKKSIKLLIVCVMVISLRNRRGFDS